jgi:flagellar hook-associated protein 2
VNSAIAAAEKPEDTWESQYSTLESQVSALDTIQSDAESVETDLKDLNSLSGSLSSSTVTSSDSGIVTATAGSGSTEGSHVVEVNSLATTASWTSGDLTSSSSDMPSGSFTITTGSGSTATITTDGSESLSDVVSEINKEGLGVTASVITDANGSRLDIVANSSGSAANFTVSGSSGYGFTQSVTGANASLTVDGVSISSASNTVTGVISGVTLNLQSASSGTQVTLDVSPDTSTASTAINQLVSDYNTLINALTTQFTYTSGSGEGVLASDSTVRSLQTDVLSALDYTYTPSSGTTTMPNLSSMGITVNSDGTLSVDSSTLDNALQNNYSDVQSFFQGSSLNGFANSLDQQLNSFTDSSDGAFTVDLQSMNSEETDLEDDISNFQTNYIDPLKTQLTTEYDDAEIALQDIPGEIKDVQAELGENSSSSG